MILPETWELPATQPKETYQLTPGQEMLLMPVGDWHAHSEGWPAERFRDHIQWGVDRGAWFLGMGEAMDFTSTSQRAITRNLRASQRRQIDEMVGERVERLAELIASSKGRWLGMLEGHHYWEYEDGTTTDQHLCRLLGCPFLGTSTLYDVRLRRPGDAHGCTITIYAHHGSGGGGRRVGTQLHRLEDLLGWVEADIYLMAHTHSKANAPMDRLYRTPGGHLYHRTKILARTGGFLRGYTGRRPAPLHEPASKSRGTYVEQAAMSPSALGGLVISLGYKRLTGEGYDLMVPDLHYSV